MCVCAYLILSLFLPFIHLELISLSFFISFSWSFSGRISPSCPCILIVAWIQLSNGLDSFSLVFRLLGNINSLRCLSILTKRTYLTFFIFFSIPLASIYHCNFDLPTLCSCSCSVGYTSISSTFERTYCGQANSAWIILMCMLCCCYWCCCCYHCRYSEITNKQREFQNLAPWIIVFVWIIFIFLSNSSNWNALSRATKSK